MYINQILYKAGVLVLLAICSYLMWVGLFYTLGWTECGQ